MSSAGFADVYSANYKNFALTPKRSLKTQISEKKNISYNEKTLAFFPLLLSHIPNEEKTIYRAPNCILTITVTVIGSSFRELRCRWNHSFLKERRFFQWKNIYIDQLFSVFSCKTNLETILWGSKRFFEFCCAIYYFISIEPKIR